MHCACCSTILPGIALAAAQFYHTLHFLQAYFTRYCIYLHHNFTGHCTCCSIILPDIALAVAQFYQTLHLLQAYFTGHCIYCIYLLALLTALLGCGKPIPFGTI